LEWVTATSGDLVESLREQVCIIPIGCLEEHGKHLPMGIDGLIAHKLAFMATQEEPAVVLPTLYYMSVMCMKHRPGTISMDTHLLLDFLEKLCDEVARNGFKKVILLNCHGGNQRLLHLFVQWHILDKHKEYMVYYPPGIIYWDEQLTQQIRETSDIGHACEIETSVALYLFPELCKMERIPKEYHRVREDHNPCCVPAACTYKPISPAITYIDWYASYPRAYTGDARKASAEKGRLLVEPAVKKLVQLIRNVKNDKTLLARSKEFASLVERPEWLHDR
jgi:creatinine amidohydrolase